MKKVIIFLIVTGCGGNLAQGKCGDGFREHPSGKCVDPAMKADFPF